ncbi:terminase large subunit domain-containing protein [Streptomyces sp. NPDC012769]|uniref:terminase large subunit domain-containing protein n=1 Tax=Streptomyces sp. NPDC012769 TaxID=3364848 RepID=UPI003687A510
MKAHKKNQISSVEQAFKELSDTLARLAYAPDINSYKPHDKQKAFHSSPKKSRLYIGGNRSGKTTGGIVEDIWWLLNKHPYAETPNRPVAGRIVSVDFVNGINKIIIPQLKQWIPPSYLRGGSWDKAYDAQDRILNFENGSFVELMSYDQDLDKFAGTSRDFIHYDEEPPEHIYSECQARLIDRKGRSWMTMTPVEGMTWIHDTLYEPGIAGSNLIDVVEVDMAENPHLDPEEVELYLSTLSEDEKKIRGQGKFVQVGGLVYKAFNIDIHVIPPINPKDYIGPEYKWYMSLDHGFNNPTAVLWHVVDRNNRVITFDEHYMSEKTVDFHSAVIMDRNSTHGRFPDINICDPALTQRNGVTGTSIQTEYAMRGIGMVLGNNDVVTGVAKVNQYLELAPDGKPYWLITENCANLIREMLRLRWKTWASKKQQSQNNPYDQIHKKDDHACDSARYFFSFVPELKQSAPLPEATNRLPQLSNISGRNITKYRVDPKLTPEKLGKSTEWKVVLNDENGG